MSITATTPSTSRWKGTHAPAPSHDAHSSRWPLALYAAVVLLTCVWVLSLPIFPSQDEPLHLYYVHIFRQLLLHQHTPYTGVYAIRNLLPPYAAYYYGLVALNQFVGLETADKIFAAANIALLATAGYVLLRSVGVVSRWPCFLILPVLLNWPLFMGFTNFVLSLNLALFALACWCFASKRSGVRYTAAFLALIALMLITHPLPWAFTIGFAALELLVRYRQHRTGQLATPFHLRRDFLALAVACLSYLYLIPFRAKTQLITRFVFDRHKHAWVTIPLPVSTLARMHSQAFSLLHTLGIDLFIGPGLARLDRLAINFLLLGSFLLASWALVFRTLRRWQLSDTWLLYAALLALALIVVPDTGAGGYFLSTRMQLPVYLCCVAAAAPVLARRPRLVVPLAIFAALLGLLNVFLGTRCITPAAHTIASLRSVPTARPSDRPAFLMRPVGADLPVNLSFDPFNWAPVHYLRWHSLLLFNTPWLGDKLIPIHPRPQARALLDDTFFNQAPEFGDRILLNDTIAGQTLNRVGLILLQKPTVEPGQSPFAEITGSPIPGPFAAPWTCTTNPSSPWYLCQRSSP